MPLSILGMGTALPETKVTQEQALHIARQLVNNDPDLTDTLERLYPKTTIQHRHVVVDQLLLNSLLDKSEESGRVAEIIRNNGGPGTAKRLKVVEKAAGPLAERAARQALEEAGIAPEEVTHLVTVSSTVGSAPGFDTSLIQRMGLSPQVHRTNVGLMMCQAALNGLRVSNAYASSETDAVVLMVSLEICSAHYDFNPMPKKLVTNAIFSDGAAALVGTSQKTSDWTIDSSGGYLLHDERDNLRVGFSDQGLDIRLSTKVPNLIEERLGKWIDQWLSKSGLTRQDIKSWAIHPGGPKILEAAATSLGITNTDLSDSWNVLADVGNMSSPTVLFVLDRLRKAAAELPCVAIAFGPGLTIEATLIGRQAGEGALTTDLPAVA
ncbi:Alpha-pyrone synthesis polyketide synthase-like Pks18 [Thalassoglobus neptunius]|uniref:Alpha-pyrone synthesis polyketide synthase-like Pks18 n=1 Tax=Thalassoglobus neptunius TaxID=1938619 RepID=A0A5C5X6H5_9PLAN|nr:type III polyketide synthase [Thalassoglobus neptunius]TWT58717.1 Alpha-pyrone synthesis polyketide synthase-like Pks18 [Thalassoglobus neptunius]